MVHHRHSRLRWVWLLYAMAVNVASLPAQDRSVEFVRDVAPILVQRCQGCHGPKQSEGNYRLDTAAVLSQSGDRGEPILVAGAPEESLLWQLVSHVDESQRMPKEGEPLPAGELAILREWIQQGARLEGVELTKPLAQQLPRPAYPASPVNYASPIPVTAIAWEEAGNRLIVGGYRELTVWNASDGTLHQRMSHFTERTAALALSPDRKLLAVCGGTPGAYGEVKLLNLENGQEFAFLGMTSDVVLGVAFRPDGQELAAAFPDQTIRIFQVANGQARLKLESHADWVTAVAWSPDGKRLVSASRDKTAKVFEADSGNLVATYAGHGAPVWGVAFSLDGGFVYSGGDDHKIHYWKADDASKVAEVTAHTGPVFRLAIEQGALWSASADRFALQIKLDDRTVVQRYGEHPDWVTALAVHSNGKQVATGCLSGQVRVSNCMDGKAAVEFRAAPGYAGQGTEK